MPRGYLRNKAHKQNFQHNLVALASEKDDLADIEIVTLAQHVREQAYNTTWNSSNHTNLEEATQELLMQTETEMKEFVQIKDGKIKIGINTQVITDDETYRAIMMLTNIDDLRSSGMYYFGDYHSIIGREL